MPTTFVKLGHGWPPLIGILAALLCTTRLPGQQASEDFLAGRELLALAVDFAGGEAPLAELTHFTVSFSGSIWNPEQGYRASSLVSPPQLPEGEGYRLTVALDLAGRRARIVQDQDIRGGLRLRFETVHSDGTTWQVATYAGTHTVGPGSFEGALAGIRRWIPALVLRAAVANLGSVSWVGRSGLDPAADVVAFSWDAGTRDRLHIRRDDGRLLALEALTFDRLNGTDRAVFRYLDWDPTRPMPNRVVLERHWGRIAELRITAFETTASPDPKVFSPPTGTVEVPPRPQTRRVVGNLWEVSGLGGGIYRAQFVELEDGVIAFEAPLNIPTGERVLAEIREATGGKPVTHVILSHFHTDHTGGLRPFVEAGATVVTAPENRRLVEELARAPISQLLALSDAPPRSEVVRVVSVTAGDSLVIGGADGVIIRNLGPTPHAEAILVMEVPGARAVVNGDLFSRLSLFNETFEWFRDWLRGRAADGVIDWVLGTHHEPTTTEQIDEAAQSSGTGEMRGGR